MDIIFLIKKWVAILAAPLSIALILGVIGLALLSIKRTRLAVCFWCLSLFMTWASSFQPISNKAIGLVEQQVNAFTPDRMRSDHAVVHVLGGGHAESQRYPLGAQLFSSSLARLVEGIRVYRMYPEATFVLSGFEGWNTSNTMANAEVSKHLAVALGIPENKIITFPQAKDTRMEAELIKAYLATQPHDFTYDLVLVSSASHLPRALNLFDQQGLSPIAAPSYFLSSDKSEQLYPTQSALYQTERAIYESLGQIGVRLRE